MSVTDLAICGRLALALVLGGAVGLEREAHKRPAGFRTHILVCMGATLVTMVSVYAFAPLMLEYDPGRIAAQVISGIGFLGAGTILREGASVRGLTTAASLWVTAGIGLAVGAGFFIGALVTTGLSIAALIFLDRLEHRYFGSKGGRLTVRLQDVPGALGELTCALGELGINIKSVSMADGGNRQEAEADLILAYPRRVDKQLFFQMLSRLEAVLTFDYEE